MVRRNSLKFTGAIALALPAIIRARADVPLTKRREFNMEIKRIGSQPSGKGPLDWFTGTVRIDPLFQAPDPAFVQGAGVTFEPGARTAWHTHPLGQTLIVTAGFGWVTIIAPTLVAAPLFFSGKVSFGGLMMAAAAFTQAQSSLRWFVDNFSVIADWRATLLRVADLRQVLASDLEAQAGGSRIKYVESEAGTLAIEALEVRAWTGHDRLDAEGLVVHPGQRLLILGTPGTEKTLLFRALAGLWPWGSGTVRRPRGETIHYMPRGTPYLPRGTLAEALSYAMEPSSYPREAMVAALASVGLQRLEQLLNKTGRWERELSMDEQLRLGFARVVLQAPPWLVMDEAFGAYDDDTLELIIDVLNGKLAHTGIVHIGSAGEAHDRLFTQVVHLVKAPNAVTEDLRP